MLMLDSVFGSKRLTRRIRLSASPSSLAALRSTTSLSDYGERKPINRWHLLHILLTHDLRLSSRWIGKCQIGTITHPIRTTLECMVWVQTQEAISWRGNRPRSGLIIGNGVNYSGVIFRTARIDPGQ